MTVPAGPVSTGPIAGDGSNALWPFTFSVAAASEVEVVRSSTAGGDATIDPGLYAVTLTGDGSLGGRVAYPLTTERVPATDYVTVRLAPIYDQQVDLKSQGDYSPEVVEGALDHIVRQTQRLRADQGRMLQAGAGYTLSNVLGAPINGRPLVWRLLSSGSYDIIAGSIEGGTPLTIRPLYADDLGLSGDGTDETTAINAALALYEGQNVIIHLKATAGYWPISGPIVNRSGINLSFGSSLLATNRGCVTMEGTVSRLTAAATLDDDQDAGDTVLAASAGSGVLSSSYSVGDQVAIGGGAATQLYRLTAISDGGSLTITPALRADVAAGNGVRKVRCTYISAGWTRHDTPTELPVDSVTEFSVGDVVWVTCDEVITNIVDGSTFSANNDIVTVVGFGSGTIKFDRPIKHWCLIGNRPRVVRVDPCRSASVSGATVLFSQAPDTTRVDVFTCTFGLDCHFVECKVPNTDDYGTRGQSFRLVRSRACSVENCYAGPAKYYAAGESYGCSIVQSTDCQVVGFEGVGVRHVLSFSGSTDCTGRLIVGSGWRVNLVDFHGLKEVGCWGYVVDGAGNSDYAESAGIAFGNPSWGGGTYECGIVGGQITDLEGDQCAGIRINSPVDSCLVHAVVFRRLDEGIRAQNFQGDAALESGRVEIICDFHRCATAGVVDMNRFGGTNKPFNRIDLGGSRWFDWVDGLQVDNCDDLVASKIIMQTTRADSNTYAVTVNNCGAALVGGLFDGCQKHFHFTATPFDLSDYQIRNPNTTTLITEDSSVAVSNCRDAYGIYPPSWTPGRSATNTTITIYSRAGMT